MGTYLLFKAKERVDHAGASSLERIERFGMNDSLPAAKIRGIARDAFDSIGAMALVRRETAALHARTENLRVFRRLFEQDYTIAEYRHLLAGLHRFHAPLEAMLEDAMHPDLQPVLSERFRTPLLERDLRGVGVDSMPPRAAIRGAVDPRSVEAQLGYWYVIEGSKLGGRIIHRRLAAQLGEPAAHCTAFFAGEGDRTGADWRAFAALVERTIRSGSSRTDVFVDAAKWAFLLAIRVLAAPAARGDRRSLNPSEAEHDG